MKGFLIKGFSALLFLSVLTLSLSFNAFASSESSQAAESTSEEEVYVMYTEAISVIVEAGTTPQFPQTVKVLMSDGEIETRDVEWDKIADERLNTAGEFDTFGKIEGEEVLAQCHVTVVAAENENPTADTPNVEVTGSISGLKKPIIKKLENNASEISEYLQYVTDTDLLCAYMVCNSDGTAMRAEGDSTNITIDVGQEHNGEVWILLKIVEDKLTETPYTVTDGKLDVTANGDSMTVVFRLPEKEAVNETTDGTASNSLSVDKNNAEEEEPKNTMGAVKYVLAFVGVLLILAAGLIVGKSADIKETNTGAEEKNPVLKLCKRFYSAVAGVLKLKKSEAPDIYTEDEETENEVLPENEENIEDNSELVTEEPENEEVSDSENDEEDIQDSYETV